MSAKYERTFVVAVPVEKAWRAFTDDAEREAWMGTPPDGLEPAQISVENVDRHRQLTWSQSHEGLEGSYTNTVTFEETTSGTRITLVRSGFGDSEEWRHYMENTARGWDESLADFALYLETGISGGRHFQFTSGIAATALPSPAGVRITHVVPDGFAAAVGMRAGDLVLRLNGAPVLTFSDIAFACREHAPGTEIEAEYIRGKEVMHGRAPLSEWNFGTGEYIGHPGGYPKQALTAA
jgi:uncharacterized protein YndB with AHSA1/START domain